MVSLFKAIASIFVAISADSYGYEGLTEKESHIFIDADSQYSDKK